MVAVGRRGLVPRDSVAGIHAPDEPEVDERLECPVHRRNADGAPVFPEPVEDLLGAQAAVLAPEQLDDGAPRTAATIPSVVEHVECVSCPGHRSQYSAPHDFENRSHSCRLRASLGMRCRGEREP